MAPGGVYNSMYRTSSKTLIRDTRRRTLFDLWRPFPPSYHDAYRCKLSSIRRFGPRRLVCNVRYTYLSLENVASVLWNCAADQPLNQSWQSSAFLPRYFTTYLQTEITRGGKSLDGKLHVFVIRKTDFTMRTISKYLWSRDFFFYVLVIFSK